MTTVRTINAREMHAGSFAAALTLAAIIASVAGAKTAKAWDQQSTGEQMNYELSYRALQGGNAPRQYRSGAYASVYSHQRGFAGSVAVPQRDFQLEGR